jgi:hypothetical protein
MCRRPFAGDHRTEWGGEEDEMKKRSGMGAAAAVLLCASAVSADTLMFELTGEFSGAFAPAGPGPYLRAVFDDGGASGSVTLTLTSLLIGSDEKVTHWAFNLDPAFNPSSLGIAHSSGASASVSKGTDHFKADGDGKYDIDFDFGGSLGPKAGTTTSIYTLTLLGITASSFDFFSTPAGGKGPFETAAHVQGIGVGGGQSGWIAPVAVPLPAPAYLGLAGLGLAAGVSAIKRRR